jgi:hypothetical protein
LDSSGTKFILEINALLLLESEFLAHKIATGKTDDKTLFISFYASTVTHLASIRKVGNSATQASCFRHGY